MSSRLVRTGLDLSPSSTEKDRINNEDVDRRQIKSFKNII